MTNDQTRAKVFKLLLEDMDKEDAGLYTIDFVTKAATGAKSYCFNEQSSTCQCSTEKFGATPPVHENCKCVIAEGKWKVEPGVCDFCTKMKKQWRDGRMSKVFGFLTEDIGTYVDEKNFSFVKPTAGESQKAFLDRCIPAVLNDGSAKDDKQAAAICYGYWSDKFSQEGEWKFQTSFYCEGKLYTEEEIAAMQEVMEDDFEDDEDIFSFSDRSWKEVKFMKNDKGECILISSEEIQKPKREVAKFCFSDEKERVVVTPVMVPEKRIIRYDDKGEAYWVYFDADTIKKVNEKYMKDLKINESGINHVPGTGVKSVLLQSWITEDANDKAYTKYGFNTRVYPVGSLIHMRKVYDDATWKDIENGVLSGMSIEGNFLAQLVSE